jgi:acyl-coenzyme A synthetase/AMP-(fatty) acid ligase
MRSFDAKIPLLSKLNNYGENGKKTPISGKEVGELVKKYHSFIDLLPISSTPAICDPENPVRKPLTHDKLRSFVEKDFNLTEFGISKGSRVAIILPNGPELAVAMISTISAWCAAPINPTNTWHEIKSELESTKSVAMIIMAGGTNASSNEAALTVADELNVGVIAISSAGSITGLFHMKQLRAVPSAMVSSGMEGKTSLVSSNPGFIHYNHPEVVLLLHTSGTSGLFLLLLFFALIFSVLLPSLIVLLVSCRK